LPLFRLGPQRTVVTLNGRARFAAPLILLAVAITSWVMAALEAMQPWISTTVTLVMSKKPRKMSFLTLGRFSRNRNDVDPQTPMDVDRIARPDRKPRIDHDTAVERNGRSSR
jgi:hypothetical protein